jgi:Zn-dependent M28 family amino/carboxypeptidase
MVVLSGMPAGFDFRDRRGEKGKGAVSPQQAAAEYGAAGILQIPNSSTLEAFDSYAARFTQPGRAQLLDPGDSQIVPTITLSKDVVLQLFDGEQTSGDALLKAADDRTEPNSFALSGSKQVSFTVVANTEESHAFNVVGIVEGSDPSLKTEYVAMGAHIDHLGMGGNGPDTIFNGADDDGSGTVSVLEIAHAFASGPKPKRSLLFVWHCGEEKGLVGSSYFTDHPTVPLERIVAQLNIDMIGRSRKSGDTNPANKMLTDANSIYVVGSKRISAELGDINEAVNAKLNKLRFDYHYDEPNDPENIYMRSDHYNYAKHGIPIAFFFDGVHEDYHRPSDEVSKIDFVKMSKVAQTVYATAYTVANLDHRLKIDHPGG